MSNFKIAKNNNKNYPKMHLHRLKYKRLKSSVFSSYIAPLNFEKHTVNNIRTVKHTHNVNTSEKFSCYIVIEKQ